MRYPWYSFLLETESTPHGHCAAGRINEVHESETELATFRLVAQCLFLERDFFVKLQHKFLTFLSPFPFSVASHALGSANRMSK